jgi:hypothetical protein
MKTIGKWVLRVAIVAINIFTDCDIPVSDEDAG